jgi:hypothetical protein
MKTRIFSGTVLLLSAVTALAGAPVKKPDSSYTHLSTNSPFTSKPPPPPPPEQAAPLDDWALGGVSEVDGGYMVTIFHKKNAGEMQIIRPGGTLKKAKDEMEWVDAGGSGGYKVERVEYGKTSWKDTVVYLNSGGRSDKVAFDEKLIVPKVTAAPTQNRQPGQPGQPGARPVLPGVQPAQPGVITPGATSSRPPRQRVVAPTTNPGR